MATGFAAGLELMTTGGGGRSADWGFKIGMVRIAVSRGRGDRQNS